MLRIFISYRRSDADGRYLAHMLYREVRQKYGSDAAFLDVDSRHPGLSFPTKLSTALSQCDAVLVVMGPSWLNELRAREQHERDWVRYEIAESLAREHLPVVPIRHPQASFPSQNELPQSLAGLALRDGVALDPFVDFDVHVARLLSDLERLVAARMVDTNPIGLRVERSGDPCLTPLPSLRFHQPNCVEYDLLLAIQRESTSILVSHVNGTSQLGNIGDFSSDRILLFVEESAELSVASIRSVEIASIAFITLPSVGVDLGTPSGLELSDEDETDDGSSQGDA